MEVAAIYCGDCSHIIHATDCGDLGKDLRTYKRHNANGRPEVYDVSSLYELAVMLYGQVEAEGLVPDSDEFREAVLSAIEGDKIPACVKWPKVVIESKEEETLPETLGQWEVTVPLKDSGTLYIEIEPAEYASTIDGLAPTIRVASYSVANAQMLKADKAMHGVTIQGTKCYFSTHWRHAITKWEQKISTPSNWHCATYGGAEFHRSDLKGDLKQGSEDYNVLMALIRQALVRFEQVSPEWQSVSFVRRAINDRKSAEYAIEKARKAIEEAEEEIRKATETIEGLREETSDWLENIAC